MWSGEQPSLSGTRKSVQRTRRILAAPLAQALLAVCLLSSSPLHSQQAAGPTLPSLDRRSTYSPPNQRAQTAAQANRQQAEALLRQRLPDLLLDRHPLHGSPQWLAARDGFLTGPRGHGRGMPAASQVQALTANPDPHRVVRSFMDEYALLFGHSAEALDQAMVKRNYTAKHSGLRTTVWQQQVENIEVFDAVLLAHVTQQGELVNVASQFLPDPAAAARLGDPILAATGTIAPAIAAAEAVSIAARHLGEQPETATQLETVESPGQPSENQSFRGPALKGEAYVRLSWLPLNAAELRLCWRIPCLLVGGIAMLRYVEGRNTEDIDLLVSLPSLRQLPDILAEEQSEYFIRGRFRSVRVDVLLTANALFAEAQESFGTTHRFAELDVPTAAPEALILLKRYALPSLYWQGLFDRVSVCDADIASLMQRLRPSVEPLFQRLRAHLETGDMHELRGIVRDIEARIARFEQLKKS